jgi:DNA (cytosine-5)-methyltransferase 1
VVPLLLKTLGFRVIQTMEQPLTFGSLFAGIGGFDLGFERAGMVCKWQVEIDDYATKILEKHWPDVHRERDVRTVGRHNLEQVDIVCGGFPCQDVSYNGLRAGIHGKRSGLFAQAVRVVDEMRPRVVVLENVAALLDGGLGVLLGALASVGFNAEWDVIPACSVGAHQIRERVFVLAYSEHSGLEGGRGVDSVGKKVFHSSRVCEYESPGGTFQTDAALSEFAKHQTEWHREPGMGRVANGVSGRVDRIRGLGNAVVPQVAEWIGRRIVQVMK